VSTQVTNQPTLTIDPDARRLGSWCLSVRYLHPHVTASLSKCLRAGRLPRSIFRVRVAGAGAPGGEDVPDVFGRHEVLEDAVRFIPHFPFEPGVRFRAIFDPRPLGRPAFSDVLTLAFSLPREKTSAARTQVQHVFPSADALPENVLRFYVCFSHSMQRGRAEKHIALLGPDGRPAPDTLYRPPVELWDRSMRHLTILLDPGRLKREVGPNRELGPPLTVGREYTLAIGSGMVDSSGHRLRKCFYKSFRVAEAVRERIAVERWKILPPATKSPQPLALMFPQPMDWALLRRTISIVAEGGRRIDGCVAIDQGERRWSFTPTSPWAAGSYCVRVASSLEDVCGNSLLEPFDRRLRSASDLIDADANRSIPFQLA
jgi:hypothetical protein